MYQRIKFVATLALLPLVVYLVYYPYNSIQNTLDFAFFEPVRWVQNGWAEQGVKIAFGTRMTYAGGVAVARVCRAFVRGLRSANPVAVAQRRSVFRADRVAVVRVGMGGRCCQMCCI